MLGAETLERKAGALPVPAAMPIAARRMPSLFARRSLRERWTEALLSRRLFILLPFAMIAGLVAYVQVPEEPQIWALAGVGLLLATLTALLAASPLRAGLGLMLSFWLGGCLLPLHAHWFGTPMLAWPAYGTYQAHVDEVISATDEDRRIVVSALEPVGDTRAVPIRRARLLVPALPPVEPGDSIEARLRLAPIPGPVLPGAYDGQFNNFYSGIGSYGSVIGEFRVVSIGQPTVTRWVEATRAAIGERIDAVLQGSSAAIGRAMVMGDQSDISDETREVMAASGLAHIYSISGLHLSIVAGGVFWLLRLALVLVPGVGVNVPVKRAAAFGGLIAAFGYLMLAGGPANIPAFRSTLMLGLIFGAVLAGRRALTMRNVALAALVIILIDPASIFRASFQLSFAAVVGLIGIYELPRAAPERSRSWFGRAWRTLWSAALTSFIAGTATLLFSAYHFQQTAPLGVIGNVLVLPVVSVIIMPFAVLSVLAMPLGVEQPFVAVMGWGIDRMVDGAELVARWSQGLTGNPLLTGSALVIGLAALAWFATIKSWWRMAGPVLAVPLIMLFCLDQRPDILIADTTQAVAVRTDAGLGLVTGKSNSFAVEVWSQHYQEAIAAAAEGTRCDSLGCITRTDRYSLAVVKSADAFAEDCGRHDLIVTRLYAPSTCRGSQLIDARTLAQGGVQWLRWDEVQGEFDIRPAIPNLSRPWRVPPR